MLVCKNYPFWLLWVFVVELLTNKYFSLVSEMKLRINLLTFLEKMMEGIGGPAPEVMKKSTPVGARCRGIRFELLKGYLLLSLYFMQGSDGAESRNSWKGS